MFFVCHSPVPVLGPWAMGHAQYGYVEICGDLYESVDREIPGIRQLATAVFSAAACPCVSLRYPDMQMLKPGLHAINADRFWKSRC